jgi:hypothetical protein
MSNGEDIRDHVSRLQRALVALAADLDAIEQRPHWLLRQSAEASTGIEGFVEHFAFAVERAKSGPR